MEELHCFPEFPGKSLCFHFIQNMALSWFIRMVRYLFPASTVQFAVNCCFMPKLFATFLHTWNVKHFCLFIDVSGQQNFAHEVVLGYKKVVWFNIHALRKKNKKLSKPTRLFDTCLYPSPASLLCIELLPSLVADRSDTNAYSLLWAWPRSVFSFKFFFLLTAHTEIQSCIYHFFLKTEAMSFTQQCCHMVFSCMSFMIILISISGH